MQEEISLFYKDSGSDKEYHVQLKTKDGGFVVDFQYGQRGSALTAGTKTTLPIPYDKAKKAYDKLVQAAGSAQISTRLPAMLPS